MDIKPIKNDEDLEAATRRIEELWDRTDERSRDELDILSTLVHAYEEIHYPVGPVGVVEAIRFHMEQNELDQRDLAKLLGSRSRATEILSGKRPLSLNMIRLLHARWHIPLASLVQAPRTKRKTTKVKKSRKAS